MNITKRQPVSVGEMLVEEFLSPMKVTQAQLAEAMGVSRKTVNELCNNRRSVTADTAIMLSTALQTSPEFWLKTQLRNDLWLAYNSPKSRARIEKSHAVAA